MPRALRFTGASIVLCPALLVGAAACDADREPHAQEVPASVPSTSCPTTGIARASGHDANACPEVSALVQRLAERPADATNVALARELVRLAPDRPDVWELVARLALAMGERPIARAALQSAVRLREPVAWDGPLVAWGLSDTPCTRAEDLERDLVDVRARRGLEPGDDLTVLGWDDAGEDVVRAPPVLRPRPAALRAVSCHYERDDSMHGVVAFDGARDVPLTFARATLGDAQVLLFAEAASERDLPGRLCRTFAAQGAPVLVELCGGLTNDHRSFRVLDRRRRVLVPEHPVRISGGEPELLWLDANGTLRLVWLSVGEGRCGGAHRTWVTRLDGARATEGRLYVGGTLPPGCDATPRG